MSDEREAVSVNDILETVKVVSPDAPGGYVIINKSDLKPGDVIFFDAPETTPAPVPDETPAPVPDETPAPVPDETPASVPDETPASVPDSEGIDGKTGKRRK